MMKNIKVAYRRMPFQINGGLKVLAYKNVKVVVHPVMAILFLILYDE